MGLKDIGATLPPGFKFNPSDEELVCHYLLKKITNDEDIIMKGTLIEVDLHTCEPWQLPDMAKLNENEWYFFSFRDRKYATGYRTNRATTSGYWKATGKDRTVMHPTTHEIVGMRKTLVFYRNRAPNGIKSGWIMHEFRLETPHMPPKEDWVLCRVFYKSKTEENTNSNIGAQNCMFIDTTTAASAACVSSLNHHQNHTSSLAILNSNLFQYTATTSTFQQDSSINKNTSTTAACFTEISSKGGDDYGFLWDMSLDENNSLGDHHQDLGIINASSNLEDMGFEVDNALVFL